MRTRKAWGIFSRIRISSNSKWLGWIGPCGIGVIEFHHEISIDPLIRNALSDRPFLFRTREQARFIAKKIDKQSNKTWTWTQHTVRQIKVTYEVL